MIDKVRVLNIVKIINFFISDSIDEGSMVSNRNKVFKWGTTF